MRFRHAMSEAWKTVSRHPARSALSTTSFAVAVFTVTLLHGLVVGSSASLQRDVIELGAGIIDVLPGGDQDGSLTASSRVVANPLTLGDAEMLRRGASTLVDVSPVVVASDVITTSNSRRSGDIIGVGPGFFRLRSLPLAEGRSIGAVDLDLQRGVAVIGSEVATTLFPGGQVALGRRVTFAGRSFTVVGILEQRGRSLGVNLDGFVFIPASVALDLYDLPGLTQILTGSRLGAATEAATAEIHRLLAPQHERRDYSVRTQDDVLAVLRTVTSTMAGLLSMVAAVSLLAACLGILNLMLVVVVERRAEIGLRMAVGATARDVGGQILLETGLVALSGGALGVVGVWLIAPGLEALSKSVRIDLSWSAAALAVGSACVVGLLAGVVPALRSAKVDPSRALQVK